MLSRAVQCKHRGVFQRLTITNTIRIDSCPVAMTCKQFHEEALEAYFDNLHVNLKATYPSEFSGDMSSFGSATFRDRIKSIEIGDWDETRRWRMCEAFKNARIELHHKYASDARKGAYYFG